MSVSLKKDVQKHVVTSGDYAFAAAGQPLFVKAGKRISYNVVPGQLVAYTVDSDGCPMTIDGATLAASDIAKLYIGVGIDTTGNGTTDDIRHIGIEHVSGCAPEAASVSSPRCGSPEVKDFYFDCTECDATYSVMVKVDDNRTRSWSPWNKSAAEFVGSVVTDCYTCGDCPVEHNCKEVACKLATALNNELDLKVGDKAYPDWKGQGLPRPYFATRLHDISHVYCLSPQSELEACEDCTFFGALNEITVNGVVIPLIGTVNPANSAQTLRGQIASVADQINQAFKDQFGENAHVGSAYVTGTAQACCPLQLHVNTCDATFAIAGISPTSTTNPFTEHGTFTDPVDCIDCGEPQTQTSFPCGIRVIAEALTGDCSCYLEKPLAFYGRKIEIVPFGDGWSRKPWRTATVQSLELPAGFGSWIQWLEYQDTPEGRGRRYSRSNVNKGWLNLPGKKARVNNAVTAECDKNYCSYYLRTSSIKRKIDNERGELIIHSNVHIPSDDAVTVAEFELFLANLLAFNPQCEVIGAPVCDTTLGGSC